MPRTVFCWRNVDDVAVRRPLDLWWHARCLVARAVFGAYGAMMFNRDDCHDQGVHGLRLSSFEVGEALVRPPWGVRRPSGSWDMHFYMLSGAPCRFVWDRQNSVEVNKLTICLISDRREHAFQDALCSPIVEVAAPLPPGAPPLMRMKEYGGTRGDVTSSFYIGGATEHDAAFSSLDLPPVIILEFQTAPGWLMTSVGLIRQEMRQAKVDVEAAARICEYLLIKTIQAHLEMHAAGDRTAKMVDHRLRRALALIDAAPASPWTLSGLAERIGMSRSRLTTRWQSEMGMTIFEYITHRRLEAAADLLCRTTLEIGTVAHRVGYNSHAAFSTAFKRMFGLSPAQYRQEIPERVNAMRHSPFVIHSTHSSSSH
jgi:AraC-like DNA-binding protein